MLPQPREAKTKRNSKRLSQTITINGMQAQNAKSSAQPSLPAMNENNTASSNTNNDNNDILDLFGFGAGIQSQTQSQPQPQPQANNTTNDDVFDLFGGGNTASSNNQNKSDDKRATVHQTMQIHPTLLAPANPTDPRASRSLSPDKLFDPNMWTDFGSDTKEKEQKEQATEKPVLPKQASAAPASSKPAKTKSPSKKPRASAPPSTLKGNLKTQGQAAKAQAKPKPKPKETNALEELHRGAALLKYPRRSGFPHFKHIQLSDDNLRIEWFSKRKNLDETCIHIKDVREVIQGQETETFKKFHQKTLEKSSFSVVYGHNYKTLDVAAKSIDECQMWVRTVTKLSEIYRRNKSEADLTNTKEVFVGIHFKDRNRPMSRQGSGNFVRANSSKTLKIDPVALKEIERDMEALRKSYAKTAGMAQRQAIINSKQSKNVQYVLSELEERIEELSYEVANIRDTELAKREVWRANVDLAAIQEKVEVLLKHLGGSSGKNDRRKSNFL